MITLEDDRLVFRFPDMDDRAVCSIDLQRTLRIPDDGRDHPLPPGLGRFALRHLDDHADRLPEAWRRRGGVVTPMHQAEALWLNFDAPAGIDGHGWPCAVKIATGKINAVSGEPWSEGLNRDPQDYVVIPEQPWLDGYCVERGVIRQFVAMPLGAGYSVEEQLTGAAEHGGLQIMVFPMKAARYRELFERREGEVARRMPVMLCESRQAMGLAPGGRMRQQVHDDPYGLDAWDQRNASRCFVSLLNSAQWMAVTGERPPIEPPSARTYTKHGLPWFDGWEADASAIEGAARLGRIRSVRDLAGARRRADWPETGLDRPQVVRPAGRRTVRQAQF